MTSAIVIAAPHSGCGKTTVSLGIMEALKRRGLRIAPFKTGPDFIDPGYHRAVTGTASVNLDGWMCPTSFISDTYAHHAAAADVAVIEGAMGLFDGIGGSSEAGSTAQVAKIIGAPVLLVVDGRSQGRSAAALVHGFTTFDPALKVCGVIFNNVGSENHEKVLREALLASNPDLPVLGCLPRDPFLAIPSRHLGLVTAEDNPLSPDFLGRLAEVIERHIDLDRLLKVSAAAPRPVLGSPAVPASDVELAVARDAAFCFVYEDNLRLLQKAGARLKEFSPLEDSALPEGVSGIYLPGGYPELFASHLSRNHAMAGAIRDAVEAGMPVYAECGGFIYLTDGVLADGVTERFVGVYPVQARMLPRRKALGYREVTFARDGLLGDTGTTARGHEFHYSEMDAVPDRVERLYSVRRKGVSLGSEGFLYKNCLASYIHLHFGSAPGLAASFVDSCREYRERITR
ncbi:cobyrinate a,c-diamide synthase [Geomonas sp. RF6]|uniref:cobyrinate a,c-diamide synthase n=1 Tax=Geomonas sp. RF6 TaxID=2897342 RepID=UPI001E327E0C|nr:cobyrinate a,c-diamide synthase [Geomonas sp. RF6]UFS72356.1 cobyrinate a,c-diamide synthase [Geomonas sp. RF6]